MRVRHDRHCWTANGRLTDVEVLRRPGIRSKLAIHRKLGILRQVLICRDLVILMKHVILWQHVILMRHVILWHHVIHRSGIGVRNGKAEASIALIIGLKSITKKEKRRCLAIGLLPGRMRRGLALLLVRIMHLQQPSGRDNLCKWW